MKKSFKSRTASLVMLVLFTAVFSCAGGRYLKTELATAPEITGTYTLILHGGRYSSDIENLAILDREGDRYTFEVYAPEFDYRVKRGVPAREALEEAERFVGFHHSFRSSQLRKILDSEGNAIGYEVRPIYSPADFPFPDIFDVSYLIEGNKVVVRIRLIPEVERRFFDGGRPLLRR